MANKRTSKSPSGDALKPAVDTLLQKDQLEKGLAADKPSKAKKRKSSSAPKPR